MSDFATVSVTGRMATPRFYDVGPKKNLKAVFRIAVNRWHKPGEELRKKTVWINCVAWDSVAARIREYGKKGVRISAIGDFDVDEYEDRDGNAKTSQYVKLRVVSIFNTDRHDEVVSV